MLRQNKPQWQTRRAMLCGLLGVGFTRPSEADENFEIEQEEPALQFAVAREREAFDDTIESRFLKSYNKTLMQHRQFLAQSLHNADTLRLFALSDREIGKTRKFITFDRFTHKRLDVLDAILWTQTNTKEFSSIISWIMTQLLNTGADISIGELAAKSGIEALHPSLVLIFRRSEQNLMTTFFYPEANFFTVPYPDYDRLHAYQKEPIPPLLKQFKL